MVIAGEKMRQAVVPKSEKVFNFAQALDLNMAEVQKTYKFHHRATRNLII